MIPVEKTKCQFCLKPSLKLYRNFSDCGYHDSDVCWSCFKEDNPPNPFSSPNYMYKNESHTIPLQLVIPEFPFSEVVGTYSTYTQTIIKKGQ